MDFLFILNLIIGIITFIVSLFYTIYIKKFSAAEFFVMSAAGFVPFGNMLLLGVLISEFLEIYDISKLKPKFKE
jgi:hypothetical protein